MKNHRKYQTGSVMVWLLVAVGLFAALGYVVAGNMRGGDPEMAGREVAKNNVTEILQFSSGVRRAVQALRIDGVQDTEISFENPAVGGYANGNCSSDNCKVFALAGGGLSYVLPSEDWLITDHSAKDHYRTWLFTGGSCIADVGTGGSDCDTDGDTGTEELLLILPYIKKNICEELNKKLGFNLPDGQALAEGTNAWNSDPAQARFTGSYLNDNEIGDVAAQYQGVRSGCFEGSGTGTPPDNTYHYYEVILAR